MIGPGPFGTPHSNPSPTAVGEGLVDAGLGGQNLPPQYHRQRLALLGAVFADGEHARLAAERRIGQDQIEAVGPERGEAIAGFDRRLALRVRRANPVQEKIHGAKPGHAIDPLDAVPCGR